MQDDLLNLPINQLGENDFKELFDGFMTENSVREQTIVKGKVIGVNNDWITVDINFKAEGIIAASEFRDAEGVISVKVGDTVEVYLDHLNESDGALQLSKEKADNLRA